MEHMKRLKKRQNIKYKDSTVPQSDVQLISNAALNILHASFCDLLTTLLKRIQNKK